MSASVVMLLTKLDNS